ncbi:hypothetical protein [Caldimonas tepidiphila]|uniref:hypothetical protein n=1 Tax=Caldimonas tepidiphila TaxID=2315841 RepID=UPI001300429D|nr:hypothetical protein [Caldimonas tepidiphila]
MPVEPTPEPSPPVPPLPADIEPIEDPPEDGIEPTPPVQDPPRAPNSDVPERLCRAVGVGLAGTRTPGRRPHRSRPGRLAGPAHRNHRTQAPCRTSRRWTRA